MCTPMDAWHPSQTFSPLHSLARQSSHELLWRMRSSLAAGGVGRRQEEDEQSPRRWWPLRGPWSVAATAAALQPLSASPSLSNTPPQPWPALEVGPASMGDSGISCLSGGRSACTVDASTSAASSAGPRLRWPLFQRPRGRVKQRERRQHCDGCGGWRLGRGGLPARCRGLFLSFMRGSGCMQERRSILLPFCENLENFSRKVWFLCFLSSLKV